ncbi:hypothetical protein ACVMB2_003972, partial [Sinorhizobium meliloti]
PEYHIRHLRSIVSRSSPDGKPALFPSAIMLPGTNAPPITDPRYVSMTDFVRHAGNTRFH